ncbi:Dihydroorotase, mitochondrial [Capsicum annuum]|nr:Dihydroorotase, mitochondrial [Capsicum annuum]
MLASIGTSVSDCQVMRTLLFFPSKISRIPVVSFGRKSSLKAYSAKMELSITRPDDWHLHLRDGDVLKAVVPHSAQHFGRAIVMPNLKPPITTTAAAVAYREEILKSLPADSDFKPLMTLYLTDTTSPMEIKLARESQVVFGVKLYPAGATTNSQDGVTDLFGKCLPVLQEMVEHNMPLLRVALLKVSLRLDREGESGFGRRQDAGSGVAMIRACDEEVHRCSNGDFVLKDVDGTLVWSTSTENKFISGIKMMETGNLVLHDMYNRTVWQSFDHPTDALLPGQKLRAGQRLVARSSSSNWTEGNYYLSITNQGLFAFYISDKTQMYFKFLVSGERDSFGEGYVKAVNGTLALYISSTEPNEYNAVISRPSRMKFLRYDYDGHLRAYTEGSEQPNDLLTDFIEFCDYPSACGSMELCSDGLCSCPGALRKTEDATGNFLKKLGHGGFGSVYEGVLQDGQRVAVKVLGGFGQGKNEFLAEIQTIGSIHHVVRLIGVCAEKEHKLLVYDFMSNGSLDKWIFGTTSTQFTLDWQIRRGIIHDIVKGLVYLHEECMRRIVHLDVKPQNILLDNNLCAKVSDFGLAKLVDKDQSQIVTRIRGTPGYLVPEWFSAFITEKADVYSFGVVAMEILCGCKNVDYSHSLEHPHLLSLFMTKAQNNQLIDMIGNYSDDPQCNESEVIRMMKLGFLSRSTFIALMSL